MAVEKEETRVERWDRALRNNPITAAIILLGVIVVGTSAVFRALPDGAQTYIVSLVSPTPHVSNGWAYVGMLDKADNNVWASTPKIEVVHQSGASDRVYPVRIGDRVRIKKAIPQVIVDFKGLKDQNVLVKPTTLRGAIDPARDYTGLSYPVDAEYEVMDLDVNGYPGQDRVMWLRLVP